MKSRLYVTREDARAGELRVSPHRVVRIERDRVAVKTPTRWIRVYVFLLTP